jgi:hypothetical protein
VFAADEEAEAPTLHEEPDRDELDDPDDDAPVFTIEPSVPESDLDEDDEDDRMRPRRRQSSSPPAKTPASPARAAVQTSVVVAIVYVIVSIYLHTHPLEARTLVAMIPLIGQDMAETRLHPGHIQLADVRGEYRRVHGDRLVFVITGTAINNAPVPVAGIQIDGRILGSEEREQLVYCGAAPQDVNELGIREIELLQTLKPSTDWLLRPGEQDRFLVAFVDPPQPITEFVTEVVAVRGASGHTDGPLAKRP